MWTCPKCSSEVEDTFEVCWNCGTTREGVEDPNFVRADEAAPILDPRYDPIATPDPSIKAHWTTIHGDPSDELVVCYQAASLPEAKFLADQLVENDIPAVSDTIDMQDALGALSGNPHVYCRASQYDKARAWLEEYDRRQAEEAHRAE